MYSLNWNYKVSISIFAFSMITLIETLSTQADDLRSLDGEWIYVEDRTEGREPERMGPPMSSKFSIKVEEDLNAVILNGHGSGHRDVRIALDGSPTEIKEPATISRYRGEWKENTFEYEVSFERLKNTGTQGIERIRRSFRMTNDGLLVSVMVEPPIVKDSVGLYRHAEDIELPTPASAKIESLGWLAGDWVGTRSTGASNEERWSPPLGGAMLAISRSVNTSGKMFAFEYLRIVERDGGLVYIAQPGGKTPTEFVLTEITDSRAVFDNPRHDYPKRIVYELSSDGSLNTIVGYMRGGTPKRFEFKREVK